ncbi:MAG: hypothetical protein HQ472_08615 [Ignavibacteria bacterium]|nr:hypothetical protein [Ignavibacteria bacterium]
MNQPSKFDQILDLFLLRMKAPEYHTGEPYYTTGSIVAAALFRVFIIGIGGFIYFKSYSSSNSTWIIVLFAIWGIGVYPAWIQYQRFNESVEQITKGTLCGSCRHLNKTNQLCMILDEHITSEEPPCEGEAWEPLQ